MFNRQKEEENQVKLFVLFPFEYRKFSLGLFGTRTRIGFHSLPLPSRHNQIRNVAGFLFSLSGFYCWSAVYSESRSCWPFNVLESRG